MQDLFRRQGIEWPLDVDTFWTRMESLLDFVARHAAEWWVAEDPATGALLGYARSVERSGLLELSELFVRPDHQSAGLGGRLLELAFPPDRGDVRAIIATSDVRALARYYKTGTVARFAIASMSGPPSPAERGELEAVAAALHDVDEIAAIEEAVLGHPRWTDYPWLFEQREAFVYRRDGQSVGFAFTSAFWQGPIAALQPVDQTSILLHLEDRAHSKGLESIAFEVPMINEVAMRHLLRRGFRIEPPLTHLMSNVPFGQFDRFIAFSPTIFL